MPTIWFFGDNDVDNSYHINSIQTRLYSLRLDCSIVSLTAANTKRMFSVSGQQKENERMKILVVAIS